MSSIKDLANTDSTYNSNSLKGAALFRIGSNGSILKRGEGVFLINPSTWEENKTSNWNPTAVPGQSSPVLQWSHSGARTVSFEALVTQDTSYFNPTTLQAVSNLGNIISSNTVMNIISGIASSIANVSSSSLGQIPQQKDHSLDISNYLDYYRSLLYPIYNDDENPQKLLTSPPLVVLYNGDSIDRFLHGDVITPGEDIWVVTSLRIKITKQLANLAPMEALVSFELMQYEIQSSCQGTFYPTYGDI